jgi:hypothetical protein
VDKKIKAPSKSEDKKIDKGILSDPDTFEASDEEFADAKLANDVLPTGVYQEVMTSTRLINASSRRNPRPFSRPSATAL